MLSDIEIAQATKLIPIDQLAHEAGLTDAEFEPYGRAKAKVELDASRPDTAKLILVTATSGMPAGSGKTTIGRAICRINPTSGGDIFFKGQKINGKISKELDKEVIRKIQMIFQDPMASLNERAKVEYIIAEGLLNHHLYKDQEDLHE